MLVSWANPAGSRNLSPPASSSYWQFCWPGIFSSFRQQRFQVFIYLPFPPVFHHTGRNEIRIQFWPRWKITQPAGICPFCQQRSSWSQQPTAQGPISAQLFVLPTAQWDVLPEPMFRSKQKVSDLDFHTFTSGGSEVLWCHICNVVLVRLLIMNFFVNPTKQWQSDFGQVFLNVWKY